MRLTIIFLIKASIALCQNVANPFVFGRSIESELGVLPDSPSYVLTVETYSEDLLEEKKLFESYYNYGKLRYSFENDYNWYDMVNRMVTLQIVNDTFSLQTELNLHDDEPQLDSMLLFRSNGMIVHVEYKSKGILKRTIDLEYDATVLLRKTYNSIAFGKTIVNYNYENEMLSNVTTVNFKGDSFIIDFKYADSLVTYTTYFGDDNYRPYQRTLTHLDEHGNMILQYEYEKFKDKPDYVLTKTTTWIYSDDGTITMQSVDANNITRIATTSPEEDKVIKTIWGNDNRTTIQTYRGL